MDFFKSLATSIASGVVMALFAEWAFTKTQEDGKPQPKRIIYPRAIAVLAGVAAIVFFLIPKVNPPVATPVLQSLQAKPNYVQKGGRVTVTLQLDKPAPKDISVALTTSDPAILPLDGDVTVPEGSNMATVYSTAISAPDYPAPVMIYASYQDVKKRTQVNVAGQLSNPDEEKNPSGGRVHAGASSLLAQSKPMTQPTARPSASSTTAPPAVSLPTKPAPLSGELLARLEEVQGRLSAEESYWEGVKSHMPAGSSIRPEITSQIYAARSAGQRCSKDQQAGDAAALSSCIDSLNDHLNQLSLQH